MLIYLIIWLQRNGRSFSSPSTVAILWRMAPTLVRQYLFATPFGPFMEVLPFNSRDNILLSMMGERWWDTTHTFHWAWGEMTLTPLDLYALTGLPFGARSIEVNSALRLTVMGVQESLGWTAITDVGGILSRGSLVAHLTSENQRIFLLNGHMTRREIRQFSRCLLLLMCHDCFQARGSEVVQHWWLPFLRYFNELDQWDWGGFVLATLYDSMDAISRRMTIGHRGLSLIWEVPFRLLSFFICHLYLSSFFN